MQSSRLDQVLVAYAPPWFNKAPTLWDF